MTDKLINIAKQTSLWIFIGLLAYMPLHIFLSIWLGTSFGILEFAKVAKDGLLVIGFLLAFGVSIRQPWFKQLLRDRLFWLIAVYAALTVLLALIKSTDQDAEIIGMVYNTRFLLFFMYAALLAHLFPVKRLKSLALKTVLASGAVVVAFGLLQYFVLPSDALQHVGYSRANGVLPAFFIDDKSDLERVMSTVRDPNSLGAYLIIVSMLLAAVVFMVRQRTDRIKAGAFLAITLLCLWLTFSRSAQLGFLAAAAVFVWFADTPFKRLYTAHKKIVLSAAMVAVILAGTGLFAARNTYLVQNVVFHADKSTVLESSNQLRVRFWQESVAAIAEQPEGGGPGTAGLASIKNGKQGTILNENYYLQIGQEAGVLGLLLFLAISVVVAWRLYKRTSSIIAIALLASFTGIALANMLVHIWSNEAVAYTWWGMAGVFLYARTKTKTKSRKETTSS